MSQAEKPISNIRQGDARTEPMETDVMKRKFFAKGKRKNARERKKREKDGRKIIIHLESPLMSSESPFLTLLKA
jgi:hypothetical protein